MHYFLDPINAFKLLTFYSMNEGFISDRPVWEEIRIFSDQQNFIKILAHVMYALKDWCWWLILLKEFILNSGM